MDFQLPDELEELRQRVLHFIKTEVVPLEQDPRQRPHIHESLRRELVALGRAAGLLSPHAPVEYGGLGLDHRGMAVVFEAATWSPLGHLALNIQAPDEGNVNLLVRCA
ncbi:MAG: acyl-CoA dehydrogenase family protein, partial [Gammaproteobacteria bacterium]